MNGRRSGRRDFLRAVIGGVALLGAGRVSGVRAERRPGHGTKEIFKSSCEQYGGVFIDSPKDKLTICIYPDGSKSVCDSDGNDCINYPPPPPKPKPLVNGGIADPFGGFGGAATTDVGETTDAPMGTGVTAAPAADEAASNSAAKRRRRHGKRRKK